MSKALLIDTGFSSEPLFNSLLEQGFEVHVVGNNPNDHLAKISNHYHQIDYTNLIDIRNLISQEKFDFLIPGCTDLSYKTCAEMNVNGDYSGIDTIENTNILFEKEMFRKFAMLHNLPVPQLFDQVRDIQKYPVIVKPVDSYSGKGITVVMAEDKLEEAMQLAKQVSAKNKCIVEQYFQGQLYSHSAFIQNQIIVHDNFVIEDSIVSAFAVDTSRVQYNLPDHVVNGMRKTIEKIADILQLKNGLIHTQFIVSQDGEYQLIELTRRCPGDLYSELIRFSTGFDYPGAYIASYLRKEVIDVANGAVKNYVIRHTVTQSKRLRYAAIHFTKPLNIQKWVALAKVGEILESGAAGRVALMFCSSETSTADDELYDAFIARSVYSITGKAIT